MGPRVFTEHDRQTSSNNLFPEVRPLELALISPVRLAWVSVRPLASLPSTNSGTENSRPHTRIGGSTELTRYYV